MGFIATRRVVFPIFKREAFLGFEHWYRYRLVMKNQKKVEEVVKIYDERYEYYLFESPTWILILGTDDSGKWFSRFTGWHYFDYTQPGFRDTFFGFDYHWWEMERWEYKSDVNVRLQGDLIVHFEDYKEHKLEDYLWQNGLYVENYGILPKEVINMDKSLEKWEPKLKGWEEVLNMRQTYELVLGIGKRKHHVVISGFKINDNLYLLQPGFIKVRHPEHGENVIEIKKMVFAWFRVG